MPSLFDPTARDAVLERVGGLTPDRKALWGRFTAPEMVCHVSCGLRQGLGELETAPPAGPLAYAPLNWLLIHVLPWPKGRGRSPPEFLATRPTTWQADVSRLRDLIRRFADRGPAAAWPASRVFGRISGRSWGVLQHKHLDHHLRQFGV
ncbi:MAG TPA: hypothetical protein VF864_06200 [Gemmatimonadales bacterium]